MVAELIRSQDQISREATLPILSNNLLTWRRKAAVAMALEEHQEERRPLQSQTRHSPRPQEPRLLPGPGRR